MCDNWLRVDRIELTVFVDNAPAIKVYKKFGFEIEGTGKKYALRNGEYVDAYYICLLYTSPSPRDLSTSRMPSSA